MPALETCRLCKEVGSEFLHIQDPKHIGILKLFGITYKPTDNYCSPCYSMIEHRHAMVRSEDADTLDSEDASAQSTQSSSPSKSRRESRLPPPPPLGRPSELPLPFSPPHSSGSSKSSSQHSQLDDTIDRMVGKKPNWRQSAVLEKASQSISLENVSSQSISRRDISKNTSRVPVTIAAASTSGHYQDDDSSLESIVPPLPPLPKNRRMRPGPKQFATGKLELPLVIRTGTLSQDFPRVLAG